MLRRRLMSKGDDGILWLYKEGDECVDVTGGWKGHKGNDFLSLGQFDPHNAESTVRTKKALSSLVKKYPFCYVEGLMFKGSSKTPSLSIYSIPNFVYVDYYQNILYTVVGGQRFQYVTPRIGLGNDGNYIRLRCNGGDCRVYKLGLTKKAEYKEIVESNPV